MQKILIIVNLVVAIAAVGVVFYAHTMMKPPATNQVEEAEALKKNAAASTQVLPVPMKKIVVNLHSKSSRLRYLDIEMNILTFTEEQKPLIKENEHLIKDIVIELASHLTPDELESVTGKMLLENRIKKAVNAKLGETLVVKQIYFSNFVVQ
jgi:flagellar FliL protein